MGHRFAEIAFTAPVRAIQAAHGSRAGYAAMEEGERHNHLLSQTEAGFIAARDSFYMATVSESGWPYVQHRGGPPGFLRVLDTRTLGFADFRGNRQYVSVGNLQTNDRVSLILMDYPNRQRLKLLGRIRLVGDDQPEILAALELDDYRATVERGVLIDLEAFDWNCPQHITPRYTEAEARALLAPPPAMEQERPNTAPAAALGDGPLELVVSGMRQLTPRIRAYELRSASGEPLPPAPPGAHLEIPSPLGDGRTAPRHYSIVSGPGTADTYTIAVARDDTGRGGSLAIHARFGLGTRLRCSLPRNHFPLHDDTRPAVLIAGGIGITPLLPMARALAADGRRVSLHFAGRGRGQMAFRAELTALLGDRLLVYAADEGRRMDVAQVITGAPADAWFYVCGPERLVDAARAAAAASGIAAARVRIERFSAAPAPDARPVRVELRRSGLRLEVPAQRSILDAMLDAGVERPFSCRAGSCRSCAVKVLHGTPEHRDNALTPEERERGNLMLPCVSRAQGECLVLDA